MTAMTLVAALASFIFLPLSQALIDAHGWRDALLVLAGAPRRDHHPAPRRRPACRAATRPHRRGGELDRGSARAALVGASGCSRAAFVLASLSTIAMTVFAIPFLLERGHSPAFAAFAVGLIGVSQIPGRLLFAPLAARLPRALATASVFALIALGITVVVSVHSTAAVLIGLVLLGMGNGMATLARATAIADLYGAGAYGTIAGVAGGMTTAARAAGPFAAALYAAAVGYTTLLWTLALLALAAAALAAAATR